MYIADDDIEAADRMLARIEHQAELLRGHPFMGRIGRVLHHARQYP